MAQVFVSHALQDEYFTSLLIKLLQFHYVTSWHSANDLQSGTVVPLENERALRQANALIAVVSKNSAKSKWVSKEIALFHGFNSEARIIPILIDKTDPDEVDPSLGQYQAIDFTSGMLEGFAALFRVFGKGFLTFNERRTDLERRALADRRVRQRRNSSVLQRLRIGSWKAFALATGKGKFEEMTLGVKQTFQVIDSVEKSLQKYHFFDRAGRETASRAVLESATHKVFSQMRNREETDPVRAIYVVEAVAEEMYGQYRIEISDRRQRHHRRLEKERRSGADATSGQQQFLS